ncbi:MAG: hypothetical protein RMJ43_13100 [Chloroherpetonaceae bacterium]|nr:hypothetical protein [Chthonomonadaceae bacterium]MDW8208764.1 hypothetical protein [Chloroherpetonaceae bacterium]
MDDWLKGLAIGLFGLIVFHDGLMKFGGHAIARRVRQNVGSSAGQIRAQIYPRGLFGLFAQDIHTLRVQASGIDVKRLPFTLSTLHGRQGKIRFLEVRFSDVTWVHLPVRRLEAVIPSAGYDADQAFRHQRLVLSRADPGFATVRVDTDGLEAFLARKYRTLLSDVKVYLPRERLRLEGTIVLLGSRSHLLAEGRLAHREGRYVDVVDATLWVNRAPVSEGTAQALLRRFNPILDLKADLGIHRIFTINTLEIEDGLLVMRGPFVIAGSEEQTL